eukprot:CAMPEP_0117480156 /NCGR_PEP_ID=MMETSP0784-20121206/12249_1 /TAXON_ID=39447 /ORGANISM="" /LENGTH=151 /DNA_ID=CAMNT_0005274593 /DNA_START=896 /DNA_END=1348 /DNA_ORIENTATION=-
MGWTQDQEGLGLFVTAAPWNGVAAKALVAEALPQGVKIDRPAGAILPHAEVLGTHQRQLDAAPIRSRRGHPSLEQGSALRRRDGVEHGIGNTVARASLDSSDASSMPRAFSISAAVESWRGSSVTILAASSFWTRTANSLDIAVVRSVCHA